MTGKASGEEADASLAPGEPSEMVPEAVQAESLEARLSRIEGLLQAMFTAVFTTSTRSEVHDSLLQLLYAMAPPHVKDHLWEAVDQARLAVQADPNPKLSQLASFGGSVAAMAASLEDPRPTGDALH